MLFCGELEQRLGTLGILGELQWFWDFAPVSCQCTLQKGNTLKAAQRRAQGEHAQPIPGAVSDQGPVSQWAVPQVLWTLHKLDAPGHWAHLKPSHSCSETSC